MKTPPSLTAQTTALLRELIRAACVNDGSPDSGQEHRAVAVLERFFDGSGLTWETVEPHPGRVSLVARIRGRVEGHPSLLLLGHTDVVPVSQGWARDPFAGDLIDGWVWGRGAYDMLHLTAAYAVIIRSLASKGVPLAGDLVFAALADEEAGGRFGAKWLVDNRPDLVAADGVLSESGGVPLPVGGLVRGVTVTVGEKGGAARALETTGTPRHASTPFGADNAVATISEAIVRVLGHRIPPSPDDLWPRYVDALDIHPALKSDLVDPVRLDAALPQLGSLASLAHAVTHNTIAPDIVRGGEKINVIAARADALLDIRILPGTTGADIDRHLIEALGPLAEKVRIRHLGNTAASRSSLKTPLYAALAAAVTSAYPTAVAVPIISPGGSDSRFFRKQGIAAYGFGMLSAQWRHEDIRVLMHGVDERIDVESVDLTVRSLERIVRTIVRPGR